MDEFFDIPEYEGYYQVSRDCEVRGLDRYTNRGRCCAFIHGRSLKPIMDTHGYYVFSFYKNGVKSKVYLHSIMANVFIENHNPLVYKYINHKDRDKSNNEIDNLEWCTQSENIAHAYAFKDHKLPRGERHFRSRVVVNIENGIFYETVSEVSLLLGISNSYFTQQLNGRKKNHTSFIYA